MAFLPLFVLCVAVSFTLHILRRRGSSGARPPPGPPGIPFFGNVFDIPPKSQWLTFNEWRKKYGDVVGVKALGTQVIILNSRKAVESVLVERGASHSGRPSFTSLTECFGLGFTVGLLPQGEEATRQRKMMNQCIGPSPLKKYLPETHQTIYELCLKIAESPQQRADWTKFMVVKNIARIAYGFVLNDIHDNYVVMTEQLHKAIMESEHIGTHPMDIFPFLRHLPIKIWGPKFVTQYHLLRKFSSQVLNVPYETSRKAIANGTAYPQSMVELLVALNIQKDGQTVSDEFSVKAITATAFSAGVDTTLNTIEFFVLMMTCNPSVQAKAQRIMDEALRGERLPNVSDRGRVDLVYIEALIMETYRWTPVLPFSIPHAVVKDDVYNGMLLKAGSILIPNTWGCLHDPEDYPDPMSFKPERFLESDPETGGKTMRLRKDVPDPRSMAFGYGRRACPGRHLADAVVWITITSLLCAFDFSKSPHPTRPGEFIEPNLDSEGAIFVAPNPFECEIKVRSKAALELARAALAN